LKKIDASGGQPVVLCHATSGHGGTWSLAANNRLVAVAVDPYDVSADGQRFLVNAAVEQRSTAPLTVVFNWTASRKN
jgi:hypothetical protein